MALKKLPENAHKLAMLEKKLNECFVIVRELMSDEYDDEPLPEKIFMKKRNGEMVEIKPNRR